MLTKIGITRSYLRFLSMIKAVKVRLIYEIYLRRTLFALRQCAFWRIVASR